VYPQAGSVSSNNDGPQQGSSRASSVGFEDDDDEEEEPEPSDSLSPPDLLPLRHEANSDFEETVEEPPDLDLYSLENGKLFSPLCHLRKASNAEIFLS